MEDIVFQVDTKNPGEDDKKEASKIRACIEEGARQHAIPIWWFILQLILEALSLRLGREVLSKEECIHVADSLGFNEGELDAALQFFDKLNIFFYKKNILPKVVFTNVQVPLDKLSKLVGKQYHLRAAMADPINASDQALTGDWHKFRGYGIITLEFLEQFPEHYVPGLFTPREFLVLLERLLIVSALPKREYFLPALLNMTSETTINAVLTSSKSTEIAALVVEFPTGWAPPGVYCCTVCHLQSYSGWKIVKKPVIKSRTTFSGAVSVESKVSTGEPTAPYSKLSEVEACKPLKNVHPSRESLEQYQAQSSISRNCIEFTRAGYPGTVTLIDAFSFFAVCVNVDSRMMGKQLVTELCQSIKTEIFNAVEAALKNTHHKDTHPITAFLCPQQNEYCSTVPHLARVSKSGKLWVCSENPAVYGLITPPLRVWMEFSDISAPAMSVLANRVATVIPHKWREVAFQLGLRMCDIRAIEMDGRTGFNSFMAVLSLCQDSLSEPFTWNTLVSALRSRSVGELCLADELQQEFVQPYEFSLAARCTSERTLLATSETVSTQLPTSRSLYSSRNASRKIVPGISSSHESLDDGSFNCLSGSALKISTRANLSHLSKSAENVRCSLVSTLDMERCSSTPVISSQYRRKPAITFPRKSNFSYPDHITPISTVTCTREGLKFVANDFVLEIPEGAIPQSTTLMIDVGVALFGPHQFPEGLRPVSPVFWVCVRNQPNFIFSKPVSLTLTHFLNLDNDKDIQSLRLTFLKAGHELNPAKYYEFRESDGIMCFEPSTNVGLLQTNHFCSLCISCKDKSSSLSKAKFCLTFYLPKQAIIGKKLLGFFFITFYNLKTCLAMVDEVIEKMELQHYEKSQVEFAFSSRFLKDAALEISITPPEKGKIGLMGKKKILRSEVDFFWKGTKEEEMKGLEEKDLYPPRLQIFLVSTDDDITLREGKIKFKGAKKVLEYDIFLEQPEPVPSPPCLSFGSTNDHEALVTNEVIQRLGSRNGHDALAANKEIGRLDIQRHVPCVKQYLTCLNRGQLRDLFQELGLYYTTVNNPSGSIEYVAENLITCWILGADDVMKKEGYTGATLGDLRVALEKMNYLGIATKIPLHL